MKQFIAIVGVALLAACGTTPRIEAPPALFVDAPFGSEPDEVRHLDLFALSPAMNDFLVREMPRYTRRDGPARGLYEALRTRLRIDYDATTTRVAAQTFDLHTGNCLSLVILTAALARPLDVAVGYRYVPQVRTWTRTGDVLFENGHVNIELSPRATVAGNGIVPPLIVDFVPAEAIDAQPARMLDDRTIEAMFRNNRAAEVLVAGDPRTAYWWARSAIKTDPGFRAAYNTLAVVYLRAEQPALAGQVLRYALTQVPDDPRLLRNLAIALDHQGLTDEASRVRMQLAALDTYQPFRLLDEGKLAYARGDAAAAMKLYRKELRHLPYSAELHYAIAVASAQLGDERGARRHLDAAMQLSLNVHDRDLYAGKLEKLRALEMQ
ncbi:MAG TPA: hypothetical protein VFM56_15915 [Solimonas sp.]|nr:hypothetical protein [Solimonas sp.]